MSIVKGLKTIEAVMNKKSFDSDGPRTRWLKVEDGQSVKIRFANELDEESPSFSADRDLAIVVAEHTNPQDYRRKAVCTQEDEGRCFGCEMSQKEPKAGWRARNRFYTNVIVDDGMESPYVAVWSQGLSKQSAIHTLIEYASDTGSISNLTWKLKRQGSGTETSYVLLPMKPDDEPFGWDNYELFDLEKVVREVPYADQESFYLGFAEAGSGTPAGVGSGSSTTNINW